MISKQVIILEDFNNCQIISDINFAFYKCPNTVVDITIVYGRYPNAAMNHCIFLQNPVVVRISKILTVSIFHQHFQNRNNVLKLIRTTIYSCFSSRSFSPSPLSIHRAKKNTG